MDRCQSAFCAETGQVAAGKVRGRDRNAKPHRVTIGDEDVAGTVRLVADGKDREATPEERVCWVRHLDVFRQGRRRVVERGINVLVRSTLWTTSGCVSLSNSGCATACCYV